MRIVSLQVVYLILICILIGSAMATAPNLYMEPDNNTVDPSYAWVVYVLAGNGTRTFKDDGSVDPDTGKPPASYSWKFYKCTAPDWTLLESGSGTSLTVNVPPGPEAQYAVAYEVEDSDNQSTTQTLYMVVAEGPFLKENMTLTSGPPNIEAGSFTSGWFEATAYTIAPGGTSGEVRFKQFINDKIDVTYVNGDQETTGTNGELWLDVKDPLYSEKISVWIWGGPVSVITFYDRPECSLLAPTGQKKVHRQSSFNVYLYWSGGRLISTASWSNNLTVEKGSSGNWYWVGAHDPPSYSGGGPVSGPVPDNPPKTAPNDYPPLTNH